MIINGVQIKPMELSLIIFCFVFAFNLNAQTNFWQPSPGHVQIPLWRGAAPGLLPATGSEFISTGKELKGNQWTAVSGVSQPTMTVYSPKGKNNGAAMVVFPGSGYNQRGIDLEGTEICDWLNWIGITAVETHLYAQGKYGFGLRPPKYPNTEWPLLAETRLGTIRMLSR